MAAAAHYNISTPSVISASAIALDEIIAQGTVTLTLNDCATVNAAAASNQILQRTLHPGEVVPLTWPCGTGLVVSAISGTVAIAAG